MGGFLIESSLPIIYDYFQDFTHFACERLGVNPDIQITLVDKTGSSSFGSYNTGDRSIIVAIADRHVADILRTLAHELVHEAQHIDGAPDIPLEGLEYEANALAGMVMREYNALHPELYDYEKEPEEQFFSDDLDTLEELHAKTIGKYKRAASGELDLAKQGAGSAKYFNRKYFRNLDLYKKRQQGIDTATKKLKAHYNPDSLKEDAPVNSAGSGEIAGIGIGPQGEPGIDPKKKKFIFKRKKFTQLRVG